MNIKIKKYFTILFAIAFFHLLGVFFLYDVFPNYDVLMHSGTGFLLSYILTDYWGKYLPQRYIRYVFIFSALVCLGVIWELGEYVWDQTISTYFNLNFLQLSLQDTMGDLALDMAGSLIFLFYNYKKKFDK